MAVFRNWVFPMGFPAKIEATNNVKIKNNCIWNIGDRDVYNNVVYCYISESRPLFDIEKEVVKNNIGENKIVFQSKIQKYRFDFVVNSCLVDFWSTLPMHDTVKLTHLRADQTVELKNLEFEDNTQGVDQGVVSLIGELSIVLDRKCEDPESFTKPC